MIDFIIQRLVDPRFLASLVFALAAAATVVTLALPYLNNDGLRRRMKSASTEREAIRQRERTRMNSSGHLRQESKGFMKQIVDRLQLAKHLGVEDARLKLIQAGYRGQGAEIALYFYRLVGPIVGLFGGLFYFLYLDVLSQGVMMNLLCVAAATFAGLKLPEVMLKNQVQKRQLSIKRAFPDALDLMLICVESGMSVEHAFRRVGAEIGTQSVALAEELVLTTAELSYLQERRQAYENLAKRTEIESVKSVTTALIQAERYGTPVGVALRVLAQESRDMRMQEAEKRAMSLPPKLTVPMIIFFLPVLMLVIMMPAVIGVMGLK
ncbi:MAG: type II secretion system F family protein [Hyphomicrobiales bacterium]|jgi:tight adherence protein C|nr:type II secretion system F family protein [Hyphomicrobiales bacterium]